MAISYNSTSRFNEDSSSSSTTTWSHTCNALDTKLIVVAGGRASITGITYNGVAMTKISDQTTGSYQYNSYYYLDNPAVGSAYNIVVTYSSSNQYRSGLAVGLSGAMSGIGAEGSQSSDFGAYTPKSVTSTITTIADNSHILVIFGDNNYSFPNSTFATALTEIIRNTYYNWGYSFQYKVKTTAGSDSNSLSITTDINNITIKSIELKEAVAINNANFMAFM